LSKADFITVGVA